MIPRALITAWRAKAPWPLDAQVEQDLVLSRAVVEMFSDPAIGRAFAIRGGTALHKLFLLPPSRYSEDIDLVQLEAGPIGELLDAVRRRLDPWLGEPRRKRGHGRVTLLYRFETSIAPVSRAEFEANLAPKLADPAFLGDIGPLLAPGVAFDRADAESRLRNELIERLPGDPWKGDPGRKRGQGRGAALDELTRLSEEAGGDTELE